MPPRSFNEDEDSISDSELEITESFHISAQRGESRLKFAFPIRLLPSPDIF